MYEFMRIPTGWKVFWGMYEEQPKPTKTKTERVERPRTTVARPTEPQAASEWAFAHLMMSA